MLYAICFAMFAIRYLFSLEYLYCILYAFNFTSLSFRSVGEQLCGYRQPEALLAVCGVDECRVHVRTRPRCQHVYNVHSQRVSTHTRTQSWPKYATNNSVHTMYNVFALYSTFYLSSMSLNVYRFYLYFV